MVLSTVGVGGVGGRVWAGSVSSVVGVGPREARRSLKWLVIAGSILVGLLLLALLSAILWTVSGGGGGGCSCSSSSSSSNLVVILVVV